MSTKCRLSIESSAKIKTKNQLVSIHFADRCARLLPEWDLTINTILLFAVHAIGRTGRVKKTLDHSLDESNEAEVDEMR